MMSEHIKEVDKALVILRKVADEIQDEKGINYDTISLRSVIQALEKWKESKSL